MANCRSCRKEIPDGSMFCCYCGKEQTRTHSKRHRCNGTGSVTLRPNGRYRATVELGRYVDENGKMHRKTRSKDFVKKADAINALSGLRNSESRKERKEVTFKELYDKWLPTHRAGKSTLDCYKAAIKYFEPVWGLRMRDIDIDDLQECMDECPKGKRTQQNMKAVCGLIYKYGVPRQAIPNNLNLATYLIVGGEDGVERESFSQDQIEAIRKLIGKEYGAEYVYCMIYLGLRPTEFLTLKKEQYDENNKLIKAGIKTEAGKNRTVTISPKIEPYIRDMAEKSEDYLVVDKDGKPYDKDSFPEVFYGILEAAGIDNPMIESAGRKVHRFTPHSCRHTFATLMMRVQGADKAKQKLIGHTSPEMLRYYQEASAEDLRAITDKI